MEVIESIVTDGIEVEESTATVSTLDSEKSKTGKSDECVHGGGEQHEVPMASLQAFFCPHDLALKFE